ncbi:MAG: 3-phosphoserine/phosphohydroxythreonine transaminase [Gammaproteobacteria bacterium]|nr:3-phosphoserine/phosphohydroxythreonine transaminase [Gammaproteobacteria bacterium]NNC98069.1 3-phosphoserine/phosphohydroxythreonine transaminase [Gammaproteobacteria bacterium]NNM14619.1 3-phosphoserine/phosphohydroxythreonine transaminase [Gammaproteobacteria bacterium]
MRAYNFSAGPATLPESVLSEVQQELLDYQGSGMSIMEHSHRSKTFVEIAESAEQDVRDLMGVSDDYAVLFLQGGATGQFSFVPQNLCQPDDTADYVITGQWSKKAVAHAKTFVKVNVAADTAASKFTEIPDVSSWNLSDESQYVHICSNETVHGVEFNTAPDVGDRLLIADMSSSILSQEIDVNKYGIIYAGAQKNIGPAGLTIVIVRKDLMQRTGQKVSPVFDYQTMADAGSMSNTPPTFAWYMAGKVFKWVKAQGGVSAMGDLNARKSQLLYNAIDKSAFYANPVAVNARSRMNIPFTLAKPDLDAKFLELAEAAGLKNLKGHRSVGGMRASIYNPMSLAGVEALVNFMAEFEKDHV